MDEILDGDGGATLSNVGNENPESNESGDANSPSGEPATNDSGAEWTSFRGNGASSGGYSDPDTATSNGGSGSDPAAPFGRFANGKPRKRRANGTGKSSAPGSKRDAAKEAVPLASLLYSTHFMASKILVPELELSEDEAKTMGRAIADVGQYYDMPGLSPQQVAWYNLASTAAMIYGTRFMAYRNRVKHEARERRANVSQMQPLHRGVM
jgi:hypothetical protein